MFRLENAPDGISVSWDEADSELAARFRDEFLFSGLRRSSDWEPGVVVYRYRNELETLSLILEVMREVGCEYILEGRLGQLSKLRTLEIHQLESARSASPMPVQQDVAEFSSKRKLLHYQARAVARHLANKNSADFSVPGSGKTTVALAYWALAQREEPRLGLLVVGPLSSFRPWEEEFLACFGRSPRSIRIRGTSSQRAKIIKGAGEVELLLASYQGVSRDKEILISAFQSRPWLLVLDESHYVKSPTGVLSQSVRELAPFAARRLILSGTPMPKTPLDLWSQITFLWPSEGVLGNSEQFELRCRDDAEILIPQLKHELSGLFHRTCKQDLGLPPPSTSYPVIPVKQIPNSQRLIIRLLEQRTLEEATYLSPRDRRYLRRWRRARIIRLLQAASNPLLLADALTADQIDTTSDDESYVPFSNDVVPLPLDRDDSDLALAIKKYKRSQTIPAKIQHVERRCRELVAQGEKVVIWTVFLGNVSYLESALSDLRPLSISGLIPLYEADDDDEAEATRERRVELFKADPSRQVLIANMGACSESISLHKTSQHALYLERSFNAAQFMQSLDRIHRQGMPPGKTAHFEIPSIPCAIERVLNQRLASRQLHLLDLLDDPMPVIGFDDDAHRGVFDIDEYQEVDVLFEEVLAEIRRES
jgi:hypothetical protein